MKLKEIEKFYKVKRKTKPHKPASPIKDLNKFKEKQEKK